MKMYQVFLGPQKSYEGIPECLPRKSASYKPPVGDKVQTQRRNFKLPR